MIIDQIDNWGKKSPGKICHRSSRASLTYGELLHHSNTVARYLTEQLKNQPLTVPVAVYGHKEPEMLIGFLAAAKSGHPYVPIDSSTPQFRVDKIIQASGASLVLTPEKIATIAHAGRTQSEPQATSTSEDHPFYILFTSGSTGEPKGVVITRRNLESFLEWMFAEHHFLQQNEVFLNQAPFSFDLSVMDMYICLMTGSTLVSITREEVASPATLFQTLRISDITTWVSTPSFAQICLAEKTFAEAMLPHLKRVLLAGETLTPAIASALLNRFDKAQVWNMYGPTEITVVTTSVQVTKEVVQTYPSLPIGYPKPESSIYIFDEHDQQVAPGQSGQLIIAGDNVSPGYLGRPDLTARSFFQVQGQKAYRTGDRGYIQNNLVFFEGRMDNQIKLHGYRIELGDIEANLQTIPGIQSAIVLLTHTDIIGDFLVAFILDDNSGEQTEFERTRTIKSALFQKLPSYMIPKKFVFVSNHFPMTTNGKIDRKKLLESVKL